MAATLKTVPAACLVSFAFGCLAGCSGKYRAEDVMWNPRTEVGRQVKEELRGSFEQVIDEIQESSEPGIASLTRGGLMLTYRTEAGSDSALHLLLHLRAREAYSVCGTDYQSRAGRALFSTLMPVARILSSHPEVFEHERIAGAAVALDWSAALFVTGQLKLHIETERVIAWIPEQALFEYAQLCSSIHELAEQAVFVSSKGQVELEFGRAR